MAEVFCQHDLAALFVIGMPALGFGDERPGVALQARTESPRDTFESFRSLSDQLEAALVEYRTNRTEIVRERVHGISEELLSLIDLEALPEATRRESGALAGTYLLDIIGRIDTPLPEDIPGADAFDSNLASIAKWRIPNTPIEIERIKTGERAGEFLFSARTTEVAPRYFRQIEHLPLRSTLGIRSWVQALPQLTGPLIPLGIVQTIPEGLKAVWLGTPIWKVLVVVTAVVVWIVFIWSFRNLIHVWRPKSKLFRACRDLIVPIAILLTAHALLVLFAFQLNIAGAFSIALDNFFSVVNYLTAVWAFWIAAIAIGDLTVSSPRISESSLDASLIKLCARLVGIAGGILILAFAGNALGLPVFSIIAGLGIGGLAVALAVRPTLENLIGGLMLYADRPVRVGDYCMFNDLIGTVERIGVRSTQIRGLDRTLISVPNARFADMDIINWAHCDQMLINETIGLRYETQPDQLRHVLAKLREMFYAHPKIANDTVRVRFISYGASSLDISIRVYALTREWNEFYAIQEDILLRVSDIVRASGTGFAFPSQTVYVRQDEGLDEDRIKAAEEEVSAWRRSGRLPFPQPPSARIDEIADTLDYPPRGSSGVSLSEPVGPESLERLSGDADTEVSNQDDKTT